MKLELYIQNSNDGTVFDASNIAEEIQVSQSLDGTAGSLSCTLQKDPNNLLKLANGSIVSFIVDGVGFFFGYIFKIEASDKQDYKITCYDQLRYLKYNDVYTTINMTSSQIFEKICLDYNLRYTIKVPSYYKLEPYLHSNKTLFTIIKRGIDLSNIYENAQYFIADRFGVLTWSELSYEKTNIQLGDNSIMTSYDYEKSIDGDTYNQIKMYRDNKDTGKRDIWLVKDSDNIKKWGTLQLLKKADDNRNSSQIRQTAENLLKTKNRETQTLKFSADGILDLIVGRGIKFVLQQEGIDAWMWIKSCTHKFTKYKHTMDLEVDI